MPMPDDLASFDAHLAKRLAALDDAALREAWHAATERTEALMAIRKCVTAFDGRARELGVDVIARIDRREGALLALRFMGLPEIVQPNELVRDPERIPRRQRAVGVLYASTAALTAEELARAVALGRIVLDGGGLYDRKKLAMLWEHPDLRSPERRFAALAAAVDASREADRRDFASTLLQWLALRLVEEPFAGAAPALLAALRGEGLPYLTDVLGALGDRAILEEVAARLDTPQEDGGVVACVFALDPAKAFDRLASRLSPSAPTPPRRRLLDVLAQDGFRTEALAGQPSARPRGWVRADPRWIEPLLALRVDDDPNVSMPAASALGHADLDLVLSKLPKPKKKVPELALERLGSLPVPPSSFPRDPVWLGCGCIVVADSPRTLGVHELAPGLPRKASVALPDGVALPAARAAAGDDAWEVAGLYDVAVRADGGLALGAQTAQYEHVIALHDASGRRVAERKLAEGGPVFPHALCFGAGGRGTLWVALVDEDGHVAGAFDPASLAPLGTVPFGASFPPPAWFEALSHPREDVGVFAVQCGQDGGWLKVIEREPKLARRKQKLDAKQAVVAIAGFSADGAVAAFATGATLAVRGWPALDAPKKKRLDGSVVGAGAVDGGVAIAVAEVSLAPSAVELRRWPDGERVAKGRYPLGEAFVTIGAGVLVTRADAQTVSVWRVRA